jgi:phage terminase small subunit
MPKRKEGSLTPAHEAFCQHYISTGNASASWRVATGKTGPEAKNADVHAARWLVKAGIKARIAEIRGKLEEKAMLTKEQVIRFLCEVISTPIGEITPDSRLAQKSVPTEHGRRIEAPGKIEAAKLLGSWLGWEKGNEAENKTADALGSAVKQLMHGRRE